MTPLQQRSYLATQGVAGEGGQFGDPEVRDFYLDTLLYNLTDRSGNLAQDAALLPIENQYLGQTFGVRTDQSLSGILKDLLRLSGRNAPEETAARMDMLSRDLEEQERGERTGNEPFGDIGVSMAPDIGLEEGTLAGAIAAGLAGVPGLGVFGPVAGTLQGQPGVQGPIAPEVGSREFADTVSAGKFGSAIADMMSHGLNVAPTRRGLFGWGGRGGGSGMTAAGYAGLPGPAGTFGPTGFTPGSPFSNISPSKGGGFYGGRDGGGSGMGGGGDFSGVGTGPGEDMGAGMLHGGGMVSESEKPGQAQDVTKTLQEGEYVMSRSAVEAFGKPIFDALNKYAKRKSA